MLYIYQGNVNVRVGQVYVQENGYVEGRGT